VPTTDENVLNGPHQARAHRAEIDGDIFRAVECEDTDRIAAAEPTLEQAARDGVDQAVENARSVGNAPVLTKSLLPGNGILAAETKGPKVRRRTEYVTAENRPARIIRPNRRKLPRARKSLRTSECVVGLEGLEPANK
jgi:hydroxypyruvate isomerase